MSKFLNLCQARHTTPVTDSFFNYEIEDVTNISALQDFANKRLESLRVQTLNIYVTGLTVALVTVINACHSQGVKLTLWHYDRDSNDYYKQDVL